MAQTIKMRSNVGTAGLVLSLFLLLAALVTPAAPALLDWTLVGVTFEGGGTVSGGFTCDSTSLLVSRWNITVDVPPESGWGPTNSFTFSPWTGPTPEIGQENQFWGLTYVRFTGFVPYPRPSSLDPGYIGYVLHLWLLGTPLEVPAPAYEGQLRLSYDSWPLQYQSYFGLYEYNLAVPGGIVDVVHFGYGATTTGDYLHYDPRMYPQETDVVPLPSTLLLLGSGLLGLAGLRRFRKS